MKAYLFVGLVLLAGFGWVGSAEAAYIDPNTGGMIFQFLAAGFALASGFVLMFASRIKMFFARQRRKKREQEQPDTPA